MTASLDEIVAALGDLTRALGPALSPATRPTWEQERWRPDPAAFGDIEPTPELLDAVEALIITLPHRVAAGELIESAWGNAVVDALGQVDGTLGGINLAFDAQVSGLGAAAGARFRMHNQAVSATTDGAGSVTVTLPAATFQSPPMWAIADDFYTGTPPGNPAGWNTYKIDGSVLTSTSIRVMIANRAGAAVANTPVGFRVVAFGRWA
jgi:hypothetical protein